jgi:tetratricopeptide (TPR) repeat protein
MTSLLPGYEYDIFISYRQKDNKHDSWVTEFVDNLKGELESTFKEEISVYFDINPHDGLLETHDVDASLKEKLKCLIFIPIISRTYCDPKSFAWENEFKAFVAQASHDQFGLKVKLPDGKFSSRVLPVRIHDLEKTDIELFKSVLKGTSGGIEFIYKSSEINRPLRSKEDSPGDNLNRTFYRDQITKTALEINKIILGLKSNPEVSDKEIPVQKDREGTRVLKSARLKKNKLLIGAGILAILMLAGILAYPKIFKGDKLVRLVSKDGKIPIAIMPFQNLTNDSTLNVWQDGIQSILITSLSNSKELKVRQVGTITSILKSKGLTDYASLTPAVTGLISKKLETNVNITGSIKQSGSTIRVNAQLVGTKTGEAFRSFQIDGTADSILTTIDSLSRMIQDFLLISILQKEEPNSEHYFPVPIKSPEAYKFFIYGKKAFAKLDFPLANDMGMRALEIDSTSYFLYASIASGYYNQGVYEQAKKWCLKAYSKLDMMDICNKIFANYMCALILKTPGEAIRYAEELIDFDDQNPVSHYGLGDLYLAMHQYKKAIPEFEKSLEIYKKWESKPGWVANYTEVGDAYHGTGQYKNEKKLYRKAELDFPDDEWLIQNQAILALTEKDTVAANRYIEKYISIGKNQLWTEAVISNNLAFIYNRGGFLDKAEEFYRQANSLAPPEMSGFLRNLAFFLIDKDRNVDEGLKLVEKYIKLKSENYLILDVKGCGLYKKGKYQEALEILQKSWDLRMKNAVYDYDASLHLEIAKKAVANQK